MSRILIVIPLVAMIAALLASVLLRGSGYVLMTYNNKAFETSFLGLISAVILFAVIALIGWEIVRRLLSRRYGPRQWWVAKGSRRARERTLQGLIELAEGDWKKAEKLLAQSANKADTPLLNYLSAARAADEQGFSDRRDEYLSKAMEVEAGRADIAVELTQAQLQFNRRQWEQCLATLTRLRQRDPDHMHVTKLLAQVYEQVGEWNKLAELLPLLQKKNIIVGDEFKRLECNTYEAVLETAGRPAGQEAEALSQLKKAWQKLPNSAHKDAHIVEVYARQLIRLNAFDEAEQILRTQINKEWSETLVNLYGRLKAHDPERQLIKAESWLSERPNSAVLLLTLGRLSLQNQQWDKARNYFESSLKLRQSAEALAEMGRLTASLGEHEASNQYFQRGLGLLQETLPPMPQPERV